MYFRERPLFSFSFFFFCLGTAGWPYPFEPHPFLFTCLWLYTRDRDGIAGRQSAGVAERYIHRHLIHQILLLFASTPCFEFGTLGQQAVNRFRDVSSLCTNYPWVLSSRNHVPEGTLLAGLLDATSAFHVQSVGSYRRKRIQCLS